MKLSIGTRSSISRTGCWGTEGAIQNEDQGIQVLVFGRRIGCATAVVYKRPPGNVNPGVHIPRRPILDELDDHRGRTRSDVGGRAVDKEQRWKSVATNQGHQEAP